MNRVVHFEIQAENVDRAKKFYGDVFGWEFTDWSSVTGSEYWGVMTAPMESSESGINGGLLKRPANTPPPECGTNAYTCTIQVENFDEIAEKIEKAGGKIAMPKHALTGIAWQGYFLDIEGNVFGIHQPDVNAK